MTLASEASASPACRSTARLLGAHLDGELDAVKTLEVEDHLAACECCRERLALDRALRGSLKKEVGGAAPSDVRARMLAALAAEGARQTGEAAPSVPARTGRGMLRHWRTMLPLASAAALAVAWGFAGRQPARGERADVVAGFGNDDLLRDFVAEHSRPVPPEQTDPKEVQELERYVGVPVHVPHFRQNVHFVGGRLMPVHGGERAAMLQYELEQGGGVQRVTIFIYDPRRVQVGGSNLSPRAVGTAHVRVGQRDGYSVAVTQHGGVGYTLASDLDPDSSARLLTVVDRQ